MWHLAMGLLLVATPGAAGPQGTEPADGSTGYYVFLFEAGPEWPAADSVEELLAEESLQGHFAYMGLLADRGKLVAGGPFKDFSGAMLVIQAESLEAARAVALADPAVERRIYVLVEGRPWHPAVTGCLERLPW